MAISKQTRKLLNERLKLIENLRHEFGREFGDPNNPDSICDKCKFRKDHKIHGERWLVECWEYEAGWGQSSMGKSYFDTRAAADAYVLDYNKDNTAKEVPGQYFKADSPRRV